MIRPILMVLAFILAFPSSGIANDLIDFEVLEESEGVQQELVIDVAVELVDDRLPNKEELATLSQHLLELSKTSKEVLVRYYLPGMPLGAGAYASAKPTRDSDVVIQEWRLMLDPVYSKFLNKP